MVGWIGDVVVSNDVKECWGRERLKDLEQDAGGGIIRLGPVV